MIHLVIGRQGSGKTLLIVMLAHKASRDGKNIYSNVDLKFDYSPLDYKDIVECNIKNGAVLLDEIHQLLSARKSMSKQNTEICDNFLSMVRKQGLEIYGTTQTLRKVDVRFREEADYIYVCEKFAYIDRQWVKWLHNENLNPSIPIMIKVEVTETWTGNKLEFSFRGNNYFKLFDTTQIIKVRGLDKYFDKHKHKHKRIEDIER